MRHQRTESANDLSVHGILHSSLICLIKSALFLTERRRYPGPTLPSTQLYIPTLRSHDSALFGSILIYNTVIDISLSGVFRAGLAGDGLDSFKVAHSATFCGTEGRLAVEDFESENLKSEIASQIPVKCSTLARPAPCTARRCSPCFPSTSPT